MTTPAPPPGFVLESTGSAPTPPPGFELEPAADFTSVSATSSFTPSKPPPRTLGQELKRSAGLGVRALINSGADLVGIVANPFIEGANLLGANQATMQQGAEALANRLGLPEPETPIERLSSGITRAVGGTGGLVGIGRNLATRAPGMVQAVGEGLAAQPTLQTVSAVTGSAASETAKEAGASPGMQVAAGLAGALAPGVGQMAGAEALRRVIRGGETGRQTVQQNIENFRAVGASPSVAQATENRLAQGVENLLAGGPTSAGPMGRFVDRQAEDLARGTGRLANEIAPGRATASSERAGRSIEKGIGVFAKDVSAKRNELYRAADELIPPGTSVPLSRTREVLAKLSTPTAGAEATSGQLINPQIRSLAQRIELDLQRSRTAGPMGSLAPSAGGLPYQAARDIRTNIGRDLSDFALSVDRPTAQLKQVYAALSEDLADAARAQGPKAEQAMKRANNYFRASADRLEQIERVVDKAGGPEAVYNAAFAGARDGGTRLRAVLQSLPKEGQQDVAAAVIKRMGMPTAGQAGAGVGDEAFSAATFLTNWNRISPEAKRALFDRLGPSYSANIDRLAKVADNIKSGARIYANPSGTANRAAALTYMASLPTALITGGPGAFGSVLAGGAAANLLARGMTNPRFVGWLANSTTLPAQSIGPALLQLERDSARRGDQDTAELARLLQQAQQPVADAANGNQGE